MGIEDIKNNFINIDSCLYSYDHIKMNGEEYK